jgi:hypothetical protein
VRSFIFLLASIPLRWASTPWITPSTKKPTPKADVVKARLIELFDLCKSGRYSKVPSYLSRNNLWVNRVEDMCLEVTANTKDGYYFGKFMRGRLDSRDRSQTNSDDGEGLAWEVYYRRAANTKGETWAFTLVNGKYVCIGNGPITQTPQ